MRCAPTSDATPAGGSSSAASKRESAESAATVRRLLRHADKFGWDGVVETAAEMGIELTPPKKETDHQKARAAKVEHALELHNDGRTPSEIASRLAVSPATARKYVQEALSGSRTSRKRDSRR